MSTLVVEVCKVDGITKHPYAERLEIATVKGWSVCVPIGVYKKDQLVVYFPPDSILPPELANGPNDFIKGRLNVAKYLAELPKNADGVRPLGGRVTATRIRKIHSFGILMPIDPSYGDDPNWVEGTSVKDFFNIKKWEPPVESYEEDEIPDNSRFYKYTDIENYENFKNDVLEEGTDVVITEKLHGSNCRIGLVLIRDDLGFPQWSLMCGSHSCNRSRTYLKYKNFAEDKLSYFRKYKIGDIIESLGKRWKIVGITERERKRIFYYENNYFNFIRNRFLMFIRKFLPLMIKYRELKAVHIDNDDMPVKYNSIYWKFAEKITPLLNDLKFQAKDDLNLNSIVVYGELLGTQDMKYGFEDHGFRAFDIAVNGEFLDYEDKRTLFEKHGIDMVPTLYEGPFFHKKVKELVDGNTLLSDKVDKKEFNGREGIVITPKKEFTSEKMISSSTRGRVIFKSISGYFRGRKNQIDGH